MTWERLKGPLPGGAVFGPIGDDSDAFDALCTGIGDILIHEDDKLEMFYFAGSNDRTMM